MADVRRIDVLIASPGDVSGARDVVERALHEWNDSRSDRERIVLRPRRWETGSVPILGEGDTQSVINKQLVDDSDIVIAIFHSRLGSSTPRAVSGTAEEIERSVTRGKRVHLYFSEERLPFDVDAEQLIALREFRKKVQRAGLVGTFGSLQELSLAVAQAIEYDVRTLGAVTPRQEPDENSRPDMLRISSSQGIIAIRNTSDQPVFDLQVSMGSIEFPGSYDLGTIGQLGPGEVWSLSASHDNASMYITNSRSANIYAWYMDQNGVPRSQTYAIEDI